jgi:tetratricopeptide (TPR) repeat protein
MKRLAEIRDRDLFTQPDESHLGECPICCLPMPIDQSKSAFMTCCSKRICRGCEYANKKREIQAGMEQRCAFCREPLPKSQEESHKRAMKRIKKNCPAAMYHMGRNCVKEGDYGNALEYLTKAAELGDAAANFSLSCMYGEGDGVEKDTKKELYHWEEAAIRGHPIARHNLGAVEVNNDRYERAKIHFIIAATLGHHDSLKVLMQFYTKGYASKEDYASALRAYQAAVEETKSADRKAAEAYYAQIGGR